jgi:hypothetical protein
VKITADTNVLVRAMTGDGSGIECGDLGFRGGQRSASA